MKIILANVLLDTLIIICMVKVGKGHGEREGQLNVRLEVPKYVRQGDTAVLYCHYDLGDQLLYTMKWYKGNNEFYRYTPKENPSVKTFEILGLQMDLSQSNLTQLTLRNVNLNMTAYYACEVTTDLPDFNAELKQSPMFVVAFPEDIPVINIGRRYAVGDSIYANCSSYRSKPAANLTWMINSELANPKLLIPQERIKDADSRETAHLGLRFQLEKNHFRNGKLHLKCIAKIYELYWKTSEMTIIEDDHPKSSSIVVNPTPSTVPSYIKNKIDHTSSSSALSGVKWVHRFELKEFIPSMILLPSLLLMLGSLILHCDTRFLIV